MWRKLLLGFVSEIVFRSKGLRDVAWDRSMHPRCRPSGGRGLANLQEQGHLPGGGVGERRQGEVGEEEVAGGGAGVGRHREGGVMAGYCAKGGERAASV